MFVLLPYQGCRLSVLLPPLMCRHRFSRLAAVAAAADRPPDEHSAWWCVVPCACCRLCAPQVDRHCGPEGGQACAGGGDGAAHDHARVLHRHQAASQGQHTGCTHLLRLRLRLACTHIHTLQMVCVYNGWSACHVSTHTCHTPTHLLRGQGAAGCSAEDDTFVLVGPEPPTRFALRWIEPSRCCSLGINAHTCTQACQCLPQPPVGLARQHAPPALVVMTSQIFAAGWLIIICGFGCCAVCACAGRV